MDLEALFKISHGVYITGARDTQNRLIGSCIDAVMVVEVAPAQVIISLGKQSYTCENILTQKKLTLSVLADNASDKTINIFGTKSSRTEDKWSQVQYHLENDLPVLDDAISVMSLEVQLAQETSTHYLFLCNVTSVKSQASGNALTYAQYQQRKMKGKKMNENKKWVCTICGYVYDGEVPFEQLPADWVCPLCGVGKDKFVQQ